jgi:hypothetical protein
MVRLSDNHTAIGVKGGIMKRNTSILRTALLFLLVVSTALMAAQQLNRSRILFIYMRLKDDVLTLEKTKVVKGYLKPERYNDGDLYMEITTDTDTPLLSRLIDKPGYIHYDYFGDDGRLKGGIRGQPDELFVIKVPFDESMKKISFYTTKPPAGTVLGKTRSKTDCKGALIAGFSLNLEDKEYK